MAAPNPHQLLLLADHIKLSLLERQRAKSLNLPADKQDKSIRRSLVSLKDGIAALERQRFDQEAAGEDITDLADQISRLSAQETELSADFSTASQPSAETAVPNDPSLAPDFAAAKTTTPNKSKTNKAVRFSQPYTDEAPEADPASRAALFDKPYTDEEDAPPDQSALSNQQIHAYHSRALADQDEQLDTLGASIGRQRELGLRMGEELDSQAILLEDVEQGVDRHQMSLNRARTRLDKIGRKAKDNWSWLTIGVLLLVLVVLIVGTK